MKGLQVSGKVVEILDFFSKIWRIILEGKIVN